MQMPRVLCRRQDNDARPGALGVPSAHPAHRDLWVSARTHRASPPVRSGVAGPTRRPARQPGDREQARADRLDLPRQLPQPGPLADGRRPAPAPPRRAARPSRAATATTHPVGRARAPRRSRPRARRPPPGARGRAPTPAPSPSAIAIERSAGVLVPLDVDRGVRDREGAAGVRGRRDEDQEQAREPAGGAVPAVDRAAAGSRRRTAATRGSSPSPTGRTRGRSPARRPRAPRAPGPPTVARSDPARRARRPATTRACAGVTRPSGIGLPAFRPASRGGVHEVVHRADRELEQGHRHARARAHGRVPRRRRARRARRPRRRAATGTGGRGGRAATRPGEAPAAARTSGAAPRAGGGTRSRVVRRRRAR